MEENIFHFHCEILGGGHQCHKMMFEERFWVKLLASVDVS